MQGLETHPEYIELMRLKAVNFKGSYPILSLHGIGATR